MTTTQTITAPDGWTLVYRDAPCGFTKTIDDRGHCRGGCFNAPQAMVDEKIAIFRRNHGDMELDDELDRAAQTLLSWCKEADIQVLKMERTE